MGHNICDVNSISVLIIVLFFWDMALHH